MGYKFSLVLSREVTDGEATTLKESCCANVIFATDSLPTDAHVAVTKMDFDDTTSSSLAEAIESALETVLTLPDLSVPGLTVRAQPEQVPAEATEAAADDVVLHGTVVKKKPRTRKRTVSTVSAEKAASEKTAPIPVG